MSAPDRAYGWQHSAHSKLSIGRDASRGGLLASPTTDDVAPLASMSPPCPRSWWSRWQKLEILDELPPLAPVKLVPPAPPAKPRPLPWRVLAFLLGLVCWSVASVVIALFLAAAICGVVALILSESSNRLRRGHW
jgi:hypothetical protein